MSNQSNKKGKGMNPIILFFALLINSVILLRVNTDNLPTIVKLIISFIIILLFYNGLEAIFNFIKRKVGKDN